MDFPSHPSYHTALPAMTRKSIETAAKGLIAVIFLIFLYSVYGVLGMMGVV
jgi:hypothetical protein